ARSYVTYQSPDVIRSPSIVMTLVDILSQVSQPAVGTTADFRPFEIDEKLSYNNVITYKGMIQNYSEYVMMIDEAYQTLAVNKPSGRDKVLKLIHQQYLLILGELGNSLGIDSSDSVAILGLVRGNSDQIIKAVIETVESICRTSAGCETIDQEDIILHSQYIVFHAFVECKVLEKP